jgi:hypothetical protein
LYEAIVKSDEVKGIEKENEAFLKFLTEKTKFARNITLDDIWAIYDPLFCEVCLCWLKDGSIVCR